MPAGLHDLKRLTVAMVVVIDPKSKSPPVGVTPPWIIIIRVVVGGGIIIVFPPKVDLFARKKGISIVHFTEGFDLFPQNVAGRCDFPALLEQVRVQVFLGEN